MADRLIDPAHCRILISNDDGIDSPGITALENIARDLSDDVWVVRRSRNRAAPAIR